MIRAIGYALLAVAWVLRAVETVAYVAGDVRRQIREAVRL